MHIKMIMKKMKAEDNIKNKTKKEKQTKKTINSIANRRSSKEPHDNRPFYRCGGHIELIPCAVFGCNNDRLFLV